MLLVVVAVKRVRTMQLLIQEAFVMAYKSHRFPQTTPTNDAVKITSELHDPRTLETITYKKKDNLIKSIDVVLAKYPPGSIMRTFFLKVFGFL